MALQFARGTRHITPALQKLCVAFASDTTTATPNHYQVLGVDRSAGAAEIKKAFRKVREEGGIWTECVTAWHPPPPATTTTTTAQTLPPLANY
jgi:hypothetical protein